MPPQRSFQTPSPRVEPLAWALASLRTTLGITACVVVMLAPRMVSEEVRGNPVNPAGTGADCHRLVSKALFPLHQVQSRIGGVLSRSSRLNPSPRRDEASRIIVTSSSPVRQAASA